MEEDAMTRLGRRWLPALAALALITLLALTASSALGTDRLAGKVTGSIEGGAGNYSRKGTVGGTEEVAIGQGKEAPARSAGNAVLDAVRQFVVVFLFGALALWLIPRVVHGAEETLRVRTLQSFVSGLLTVIGYVVAMILVFIVMILLGILFGLLTLGALAAIEVIAGILIIFALTF